MKPLILACLMMCPLAAYAQTPAPQEAICKTAVISMLTAWGNPIESLALALQPAGEGRYFARVEDLGRHETWRKTVARGECSVRLENTQYRVDTFTLTPAQDPAVDCQNALLHSASAFHPTQVEINGSMLGQNGLPSELAATLTNAQGQTVAQGSCALSLQPDGSFLMNGGQAWGNR